MTIDPDDQTLIEYLRSVHDYLTLEYPVMHAVLVSPTSVGLPDTLCDTINRIAWNGFVTGQTPQWACGLVAMEYRAFVGDLGERGA